MRRLVGSNPTAPARSHHRRGGRADNCTSLLMRSRATSSTVGSNPTLSAEHTEAWQSQADRTVPERRQTARSRRFESFRFRQKRPTERWRSPADRTCFESRRPVLSGPEGSNPSLSANPPSRKHLRGARRGCDLGGVAQRQSNPLIRGRREFNSPLRYRRPCVCARVDQGGRLQSGSASDVGSNPSRHSIDLAGVAKWQPRWV